MAAGEQPMVVTGMPTPTVTSAVVADDLPWVVIENEWGESQVKMLRASLIENSYSLLIRWSAGIKVPKHYHFGSVHAWTLAGQWRYAEYDWVARPGTYVFEPAGTIHSLCVDEDTEALFVVNGGQVDFSPEGDIISSTDASTALAGYQMGLEAMGRKLPPGVILDRA